MLMYYTGNSKTDIDIVELSLTEMDVSGQYEKEFPYLITLVISNKQMALCRFIFLLRLLVTKKGYIVEIIDGRSEY